MVIGEDANCHPVGLLYTKHEEPQGATLVAVNVGTSLRCCMSGIEDGLYCRQMTAKIPYKGLSPLLTFCEDWIPEMQRLLFFYNPCHDVICNEMSWRMRVMASFKT